MTKSAFLFLLPFLAFSLCGCGVLEQELSAERVRGSGRMIQQDRDVHGFEKVRLACVGDLNIRQGDREALNIEAEDNILPRIRTDVEGGELVIRTEHSVSLSPTTTIRYTLMVKALAGLELSGSGKIHTSAIRSRDFSIRLSGSGDIGLDELTAETLTTSISGSGSIKLPGKVTSQNVRISGSGDYDARELQSRSADITVSGSGDSTIWAQEELSARISGSGKVDYYGNPRVSQHVSGSGKIHNAGARP